MRAYSTDLRSRIVRVMTDGRPMREADRRFGMSDSAVKRRVVRQQETGSLERSPIPDCPRWINEDQEAILCARLRAGPDATVLEHCAWWGRGVVLDNLSVHKATCICQAIAAFHCEALFLPPHSPDFTLVEQAVSKAKATLRGLGALTHAALRGADRPVGEAITRDDAVASFAHAGYSLPVQRA